MQTSLITKIINLEPSISVSLRYRVKICQILNEYNEYIICMIADCSGLPSKVHIMYIRKEKKYLVM